MAVNMFNATAVAEINGHTIVSDDGTETSQEVEVKPAIATLRCRRDPRCGQEVGARRGRSDLPVHVEAGDQGRKGQG
eukprot:243301-Prymnesium_polylepis.1